MVRLEKFNCICHPARRKYVQIPPLFFSARRGLASERASRFVMALTHRSRHAFVLFIAIALLPAAAVMAYRSAQSLLATGEAITYSSQLVLGWQKMLGSFGAMDSLTEAYAIQGDGADALQYRQQAGQLQRAIQRQEGLAQHDLRRAKEMQAVARELAPAIASMNEAFALRDAKGLKAARGRYDQSRALRSRIYLDIGTLMDRESSSLLLLPRELRVNGSRVIPAISLGMLLACLLIAQAYFSARRQLVERQRSEERYRRLFEYNQAGVYRRTLAGRMLDCNPATAAILGYDSVDEVLRIPVQDLYVNPAEADGFTQRLQQDGSLQSREEQLRRKDGSTVWVLVSASLQREAGGTPIVEGTLLNIDERRQLEDRLRHAQKMEAIGTLAGGIAHDFNNLLTVVSGHTELLMLDPNRAAADRARLAHIKKAAEDATQLTRQLLAFGRRQILQARPVDLNRLICQHADLLRPLIGENVRLKVAPAAVHAWVFVDPGQMGQAIINLVVNARDAMPEGGTIRLGTRVAETSGGGNDGSTPGWQVVLSVADSGHGMDEATCAKIFEPFFTTKKLGTGLGLATVHGIVEQSGGHITVASQEGRGTKFEIFLPLVRPALPAVEDPAAVAVPPVSGAGRNLPRSDTPLPS